MKQYLIVLSFMLLMMGCQSPDAASDADSLSAEDSREFHPSDLGLTIGSLGELVGYDSIRVRGRSIVMNLPGTGSAECPPLVRDYLTKQIRVFRDKGYLTKQYENLTAEQIIRSNTTAAVEVSGVIPAGAPKGTAFDVEVYIPWESQTTSLQGGILFPAEMQVVVAGFGGQQLARRTTAMAAGSIFINPFSLSEDSSFKPDPRRGKVIGGGYSLSDRKIQLALFKPDSAIAQQIQRRINARFQDPMEPRVADATRPVINLTIPGRYRNDYQHFIDIVLNMYLQSSSVSADMKLKELSQMAREKDANYEAIALSWEAIGRNSITYLEPLFVQTDDPALQYYAARTALHLDDKRAIDILIELAQDPEHPFRLHAIKSLGRTATDIKANIALAELLNDKSTRVRLLAYDALRKTRSRKIHTIRLPYDVTVDMVDSVGEGLLCVWTLKEKRIVIFGKNLVCRRNFFFETDNGAVTLNGHPDEDYITIIHQNAGEGDYISERSSRSLQDLIYHLGLPPRPENQDPPKSIIEANRKYGVDLTYSQMAGILYHLCVEEVIAAKFILMKRLEDLLTGKTVDNRELKRIRESLEGD